MHLAKQDQAVAPSTGAAGGGVSRRDFIKGGVLAGVAGGVGLGAAYFGYGQNVSNPVRVGVIGTGDEGNVLIGAINPDYIQVVAIADIRPYNIHRAFHGDDSSPAAAKARPGLLKKYGWATRGQAEQYVKVCPGRYEELLDHPDVEAVIIALPLHLHAEASIKAMLKGKHVMCEKLMAHSVHECKEMALFAAQTGRLLAVGHQRHYSILYDNAAETIRRGVIGDVHHIRAQWNRGNQPGKDSWQQPLPTPEMAAELARYGADSDRLLADLAKLEEKEPPQWDAKSASGRDAAEFERRQLMLRLMDQTVDAKKYGYRDFVVAGPGGKHCTALEELIRWRLFNRTSGGLMAELGGHQLDASSIFVSAMRNNNKPVHPLTVHGVGGRHLFPPDRDSEDHVYCLYEFPGPDYFDNEDEQIIKDPNKKIVVAYSSINGNGFGHYGEVVMGTKGTLIVDQEQEMFLVPAGKSAQTTVQAEKGGAGPTLDTTASGGPQTAKKQGGNGPVSKGYTEELEHWAWCIRNPDPGNLPRCHPEVALADAAIALVSNISIREGRPVEFKPEWFKIDSPETPEGVAPDLARYKL